MSDTTLNSKVRRRDFLFGAAVGGGALLGAGLVSTPAAASNKVSPRAVQYRTTPDGNHQCSNCLVWVAPDSCKLVDGKIAPTGWCILYRPK